MLHRLYLILGHFAKSNSSNILELQEDMKCIMHHTLRHHTSCRSEVCPDSGDSSDVMPTFDELKKSELFDAESELLNDQARKAYRLRMNLNTNYAEGLFGVMNKFNMGKRVDLASRGEYYRRAIVAALNWNTTSWISEWFKKATSNEPGRFLFLYFFNDHP